MNMIRMNEEYTQIKNFVLDVGADMIGSLIFAAGLICFMEPANIAPGGTSSVALLINYVSGLPIGMLNLAVNIPLLILALLYLGRTFALKTIKSVFINTIMMDFVVAPFFPVLSRRQTFRIHLWRCTCRRRYFAYFSERLYDRRDGYCVFFSPEKISALFYWKSDDDCRRHYYRRFNSCIW